VVLPPAAPAAPLPVPPLPRGATDWLPQAGQRLASTATAKARFIGTSYHRHPLA